METATAGAATPVAGDAAEQSTGSKTIADLLPLAAERHADLRAVTYKDPSGQWVSKTYREVGETVKSLSLGLIDLGIVKGDKVSILANTRPEWTYVDYAALTAGATVVPIYQTNSPEECQYVMENSDAKAVIVEDEEQMEKVRAARSSSEMASSLVPSMRITCSSLGSWSRTALTFFICSSSSTITAFASEFSITYWHSSGEFVW